MVISNYYCDCIVYEKVYWGRIVLNRGKLFIWRVNDIIVMISWLIFCNLDIILGVICGWNGILLLYLYCFNVVGFFLGGGVC